MTAGGCTCRLSALKKQHVERLDTLESRLSAVGSDGDHRQQQQQQQQQQQVPVEQEQVRADVIEAELERRLTQLQQQMRQETADKCQQLEKVSAGFRPNWARCCSSGVA